MDFVPVVAFICGFLACAGFIWLAKRYALSIYRSQAGQKGNEKKAEQENRLMAFLIEIKGAHDAWKTSGGTDLKDFGLKVVPSVLLKYPDVVMKQGKQLMKLLEGEGLEGLI